MALVTGVMAVTESAADSASVGVTIVSTLSEPESQDGASVVIVEIAAQISGSISISE